MNIKGPLKSKEPQNVTEYSIQCEHSLGSSCIDLYITSSQNVSIGGYFIDMTTTEYWSSLVQE